MSTKTLAGSNISVVKAHNIRALLNHFLREGRVSRAQLAERTSLSNTTVTNLIAELMAQGVVAEEGNETLDDTRASTNGHGHPSERVRRVGRPRTTLRLNPNAQFAVGVHVGIGILRAAVVNLQAEVVYNAITHFDTNTSPSRVLNRIARLATRAIRNSEVDRRLLVGLGLGASGLVDHDAGVNVLAPNLGWCDVPIRDWLVEKLGMPVAVENNVRAMALGEATFGAGRGAGSLAFVYGRVGVGAGLVVNGQLFRGSGAGAGEIGHMVMVTEGGERCSCGKRGCLETLISEPVLIREAQTLARRRPHSILARQLSQADWSNTPNGKKPIAQIFAAARMGDAPTRAMITERARYLGIALANLVNIFNPELVLLGGMFAEGHDLILPTAERTMRERTFANLGERVRVQPTTFGWRAGVIGAASLALSAFFYGEGA